MPLSSEGAVKLGWLGAEFSDARGACILSRLENAGLVRTAELALAEGSAVVDPPTVPVTEFVDCVRSAAESLMSPDAVEFAAWLDPESEGALPEAPACDCDRSPFASTQCRLLRSVANT